MRVFNDASFIMLPVIFHHPLITATFHHASCQLNVIEFNGKNMSVEILSCHNSRKRSLNMMEGPEFHSNHSMIDDLPLECIALILSHTTPADAVRFASISSLFSFVLNSNLVWEGMVPSDIETICYSTWPSRIKCVHKKECFLQFRKEKLIDSGYQSYTLDSFTGGLCRKLSFQRMNIAWGKDERFWRVEESRCSNFGKVAHLLAVCWLEINGVWNCTLPPGTYSVKWRIKVTNPQGGRMNYLIWKNPVTFVLETNHGQKIENELDMSEAPFIGFEQWAEFEIGIINVSGSRRNVKDMQLSYSIREVDCNYWKGGLFIDCLIIQSC